MNTKLADEVGEIMREAARDIVLPRFGRLCDQQIDEKTPGEIVTVVDREAERFITPRLKALFPGSHIIGEEQASQDPSLLESLEDERVWLVDPLDGTANFARGDPNFAVMIALLVAGETVAAWLLDPLRSVLSFAERGSGAFVEGRRIRSSVEQPSVAELRGAVLTRFLPSGLKQAIESRVPVIAEALPGVRCAGIEYPAIALGAQHFALFWRTLPWDHAPGVLFLTEAGGRAARVDGAPYRPGDGQEGLLAAENEAVWSLTHRALLSAAIGK